MAHPQTLNDILTLTQHDNGSSQSISSESSILPMSPSLTSPASGEVLGALESAECLMAKYNPAMQTTFARDEERAHVGLAPSISLVKTIYGRNTAESWMQIQLNNLSEFAGCKEKLKSHQIAELAQMIIDGYPHYKLTEFMLFFQRFKRCEYGKFYGAVDPMVILQALATFDEERARVLERVRVREEKEKKRSQEEANQALRRRYIDRVPGAFTPAAPIDFLQYRLMGYDCKSDEELAQEIADIQSGRKQIPTGARNILAYLKAAFAI